MNYSLRGKCKELSELEIRKNPDLILVRGYYICPIWGKQQHWWTKSKDGRINDPTVDQFPSNGLGEYIEFDGSCECSQCKKQLMEDSKDIIIAGSYVLCSNICYGKFVGVF